MYSHPVPLPFPPFGHYLNFLEHASSARDQFLFARALFIAAYNLNTNRLILCLISVSLFHSYINSMFSAYIFFFRASVVKEHGVYWEGISLTLNGKF